MSERDDFEGLDVTILRDLETLATAPDKIDQNVQEVPIWNMFFCMYYFIESYWNFFDSTNKLLKLYWNQQINIKSQHNNRIEKTGLFWNIE